MALPIYKPSVDRFSVVLLRGVQRGRGEGAIALLEVILPDLGSGGRPPTRAFIAPRQREYLMNLPYFSLNMALACSRSAQCEGLVK